MNPFDDLVAAFQKSFEDKFFSKAERDALRLRVVEAKLDQQRRDVLRSKLYAMAKAAAKDSDTQFAFDWLEAATRVLEDKVEQAPKAQGSTVHFSPGETCLGAIVSLVHGARKTLDICVFTISDDRISDALVQRHRAGTKVRLITDNEKLMDAGSDIERLVKAGIAVKVDRTEHHMHHKFAVADAKTVLTGSYNWTRSAAQYNEENLLVTTEAAVAGAFMREFEKMWAAMEKY